MTAESDTYTRFERRGPAGSEIPILTRAGSAYDLRPLTTDISSAFIGGGGFARARAALAAGELIPIDVAGLRYGAPISDSRAVVCIGQNYAAHAAETGDPPPASPIVFFKHPATIVGPEDSVPYPREGSKLDWEVELAIVIGRTARYLSGVDEAASVIAGYTVSNDVSERRFQSEISGGQWSKGKSFEAFNPLGPGIVPHDELGPRAQALGLRSWVNGEPRQRSSTADMIFSIGTIVAELSQFMVLGPGDIINTGTPQGVAMSGRFPYLRPGDVVELEIDALGRQRQLIGAPQ